MYDSLTTLLNLAGIAAIAVGTILFLWRVSERSSNRHDDFVLGYPPDRFPAHDIVGSRALTALAATQRRLLSIYTELPSDNDSTTMLYTFLHELRAIMDVAYRVAVVTRAYGAPAQLDRLVAEVQQIEKQLADHVVHRLLAYEADEQTALLTHRLESLRQCVYELTPFAEARVPLLQQEQTDMVAHAHGSDTH